MVTYGYSEDGGKTWVGTKDQTSPFKIGEKKSRSSKWKVLASVAAPAGTGSGPDVTPIPPPPPPPTPTVKSLGRIAVVNASNESDEDVKSWAMACKKQADMHISQYWGYTVDVDFVAKGHTIPQADFYCGILNTSEEAGVLGWHDYQNGKPLIKIFAAECKKYNIPISSTISHEFAETIGDEDCNTTVKGFDEQGKPCLYFRENADPVEDMAYGYFIDNVNVSDFITPQWFVKDGTKPLDFTNACTKPYQIKNGGYMLISYNNGVTWDEVDKFSKAKTLHKRSGGRWEIYQKVWNNEELKKAEFTPGKSKAGGKLLSQLKK